MTVEGQVRHSFPAWRIYVFGVDVTEYVTTCNLNWNDGRAPNTAEFVLASERDRFVITSEDIAGMYQDIPLDTLASDALEGDLDKVNPEVLNRVDQALREQASRTIQDDLKRLVVTAKIIEREPRQTTHSAAHGLELPASVAVIDAISVRQSAQDAAKAKAKEERKTSIQEFAELTGDFLRFPFQVGSCIFHTGDPVTIFWRDPFDPQQWYFGGRGYVSDWKEAVDVNGKRSVTIVVEDILRLFKLARVSVNPGIFDASIVGHPKYDWLFRTFRTDGFSGFTLPDLLFSMVFGIDSASPQARARFGESHLSQMKDAPPVTQFYYGAHGKKVQYSPPLTGIGNFNISDSRVFEMGPGDPVLGTSENVVGGQAFEHLNTTTSVALETWQRRIDHVIPRTILDVLTMARHITQEDGTSVVPSDVEASLRKTFGSPQNDDLLDPDLVMKTIGESPQDFPIDGARVFMLIPSSLGPGLNRDILTNELLDSIALNTEFTSRLQILYNTLQRIDFSLYATPRGDVVCEMPLYSFRPEDFGVYADRYKFPKRDVVNFESVFSDEKIKTQFLVSPNIVKNWPSIGQFKTAGYPPATITRHALVPAFGIRQETAEPWGFIATADAAAYYAHLKLTQLNADAWQQQISTVVHLGVGPNRPCLFEPRDCIATIRSITNSITWGQGGSVGQTLRVNYRRGWSGLLTKEAFNGKRLHVYESFGGRASEPLDYSMTFGLDTNASTSSTKEQGGSHDHAHVNESAAPLSADRLARNESFVREQADKFNEWLRDKKSIRSKLHVSFVGRTQAAIDATVNKGTGVADTLHRENLAIDMDPASVGLDPKTFKTYWKEAMKDKNSGVIPIPEEDIVIHKPHTQEEYPSHHVHVEWEQYRASGKVK